MQTTDPIANILERFRQPADQEISRILSTKPQTSLYEMARYHLGLDSSEGGIAGIHSGKRVRAAICCLSCAAAGGDPLSAASAAAAIELLHSFTLIHDDIADRDEMRRGRPAVWRNWGVGHALTTGDALFALANLVASNPSQLGIASETVCEIVRQLNEATLTICEGQQFDLSYEGREDISVDDYIDMIGRKTAALFAAACSIGVLVAGGDLTQRNAMSDFGRQIGLGFQIRDDVLGIWGDSADLGKPIGSDLKRNKRSLPIVWALMAPDRPKKNAFMEILRKGIEDDQQAAKATRLLDAIGARDACERMARSCLDRGIEALNRANPQAEPAADLQILASFLVERTS